MKRKEKISNLYVLSKLITQNKNNNVKIRPLRTHEPCP